MRIAIQGVEASFHDQAARQWFGDRLTRIISADTFSDVFKFVANGDADALVVAIENTLYGSINQVYDLIERYDYPIIGEIHLPIHHQLIGAPDHEITHIYSHPVALAQCEQFLDTHFPKALRVEYHDTAAAVEYVKQLDNPSFAAIASEQAASLYKMPVLRQNIEDNPANFTRFLVLQPSAEVPTGANRTSLVITTNHEPGALAQVLTVFATRGINLTKLQSRPIVGRPWHYRFYLVLDAAGKVIDESLEDIAPCVTSAKILGEYVRAA